MPSACSQCVEALVITIGAINQNKIKDRLSGCWKLGEPILYMNFLLFLGERCFLCKRGLHVHTTVNLDHLTSHVA